MTAVDAESLLGRRRGVLFSVEGVWGAGKTTTARHLGDRLRARGFATHVQHYGAETGMIEALTKSLTENPLRRRTGVGGFDAPHHGTLDVFLRLCREAYHHIHSYRPALEGTDVVILDHGVYSKLAYYLAILSEQYSDREESHLLTSLVGIVEPWFLFPDAALYLDVPWPLARERAIARASGGGNPASLERLLFLPRYEAAYRFIAGVWSHRFRRVVVDLRGIEDVVDELETIALAVVRTHSETGVAA
jgi:dTMP kinase